MCGSACPDWHIFAICGPWNVPTVICLQISSGAQGKVMINMTLAPSGGMFELLLVIDAQQLFFMHLCLR